MIATVRRSIGVVGGNLTLLSVRGVTPSVPAIS
jgi:hypothetical protein